MELEAFLQQTQAEVRSEIGGRLNLGEDGYPYPELVFAEIVMQHMSEIGMSFEPVQYRPKLFGRISNLNERIEKIVEAAGTDQLTNTAYLSIDSVTVIGEQ